jgi:DHA1 family multidrug resistance protein-like MFS transporter
MPVMSPQKILRRLQLIVAIQWMGATLGLPLLSLFLRERGISTAEIGVIMSAFFVAGVVTQFLAGHLADRFGRRVILASGLFLYAVASPTYLLAVPAVWFIITRAIQGAAAGAIEVSSLSTVAALFPENERGAAMSKIYAAQLLGIATGPLVGVFITVDQLGWAYLVAGITSAVAGFFTLKTLPAMPPDHHHEPLPSLQITPQVIGAVVGSAAVGLCVGVYETCWSLLMNSVGASSTQIRLSWTFFCLPWVILAGVGGRMTDRFDRRIIAILGGLNGSLFLFLYPHIHNIPALLVLGSGEAIGAALCVPALSSLLTQGAHDRELGRRQGISTTANTAALAISAILSGYLFEIAPGLPFTVIAVASALLVLTELFWWRATPGRIDQLNSKA